MTDKDLWFVRMLIILTLLCCVSIGAVLIKLGDLTNSVVPVTTSVQEVCSYQDTNVTILGCAAVDQFVREKIQNTAWQRETWRYSYSMMCDTEVYGEEPHLTTRLTCRAIKD